MAQCGALSEDTRAEDAPNSGLACMFLPAEAESPVSSLAFSSSVLTGPSPAPREPQSPSDPSSSGTYNTSSAELAPASPPSQYPPCCWTQHLGPSQTLPQSSATTFSWVELFQQSPELPGAHLCTGTFESRAETKRRKGPAQLRP